MAKRGEATRRAWRKRKESKDYKGICSYCQKIIWVKGIKRGGKWWHRNCYERHVFRVPK